MYAVEELIYRHGRPSVTRTCRRCRVDRARQQWNTVSRVAARAIEFAKRWLEASGSGLTDPSDWPARSQSAGRCLAATSALSAPLHALHSAPLPLPPTVSSAGPPFPARTLLHPPPPSPSPPPAPSTVPAIAASVPPPTTPPSTSWAPCNAGRACCRALRVCDRAPGLPSSRLHRHRRLHHLSHTSRGH